MYEEFDIEPAVSQGEVSSSELRDRISTLKVPKSEEFIAHSRDGSEAGFLSIEPIEYSRLLFIQTIFVLPEFRRRGLGSSFLAFAENLAEERGFPVIWLRPRSLDVDINDDELVEWYSRMGYKWDDTKDHMEKAL